ncbi:MULTISPECIES: antiterminator Q family protein [unclassified Erwinia]|uniref:antiterminator Q family protein n=1 Tax=Erwinia TaxID=551 RepID=UPI000831D466|nr:antiterminator Q family protein [Erwinia sp. ErVv1]
MRDIQKVLERWGGWAAAEGTQLDWSPVAAGFKSLLPTESKSRLSCCDNDGMIIDSAIATLKRVGRDEEVDLVVLHYMYNVSKSGIARKLKCSEGKIRNQLMIAETFIDACIIMTDAKLEMDAWV